MNPIQRIEQLIAYTPYILVASFIISFGVCILILPKCRQRISKATILSAAVPLFACWLPSCFAFVYALTVEEQLSRRVLASGWICLIAFPHSIPLAGLTLFVFLRHRRAEERSYSVEALTALSITVLGTYLSSILAMEVVPWVE